MYYYLLNERENMWDYAGINLEIINNIAYSPNLKSAILELTIEIENERLKESSKEEFYKQIEEYKEHIKKQYGDIFSKS